MVTAHTSSLTKICPSSIHEMSALACVALSGVAIYVAGVRREPSL